MTGDAAAFGREPATTRTRLTGAVLALLLQTAFIGAFLHAFSSQTPPAKIERELTFFLPRLLPKTPPVTPAPRSTSTAPNLPLFVLPPLSSIRPAPPVANAPPVGLQNFGRALFGCAPENYPSLTPQQRALCPNPAEGVAIQSAPDLMAPPPQAKDEAYWQEQRTRERLTVAPCPSNVSLMSCLTEQNRAERKREEEVDQHLADAKAAALKEPERPLPQNIGALRNQRPAASSEGVGVHPQ